MPERFIIEDLGRHTAEYDIWDGSLRLSWPGEQTFLSNEEVIRLQEVLAACLKETRSHWHSVYERTENLSHEEHQG